MKDKYALGYLGAMFIGAIIGVGIARSCLPPQEEYRAVLMDTTAPDDTSLYFKPSFWELENMPFIDSMTIWTRAATIRVNGHYFRRGNMESGVWISRTPEEIEEMETFARHKELFRPPMLIKGDKP